jgi:hypothetical protein
MSTMPACSEESVIDRAGVVLDLESYPVATQVQVLKLFNLENQMTISGL